MRAGYTAEGEIPARRLGTMDGCVEIALAAKHLAEDTPGDLCIEVTTHLR